jgi:lysophospholipase L1-like esterase
MAKRIMCFGDSLTWGWNPILAGVPIERYGKDKRWTGVLARHLGDEYEVVEEGLSGRTTGVDDPLDPRLNGASYLPSALASHLPLDLVVLMLGTNDTKVYFNRTPFDIAAAMGTLVTQVAMAMGGVGTVYPAPCPWLAELFVGGREKTLALSAKYRKLASFFQVPFFDAGEVISTDGVDGIHFSEQNNADLGKALAKVITSVALPDGP